MRNLIFIMCGFWKMLDVFLIFLKFGKGKWVWFLLCVFSGMKCWWIELIFRLVDLDKIIY